jgi:hypothetical protein
MRLQALCHDGERSIDVPGEGGRQSGIVVPCRHRFLIRDFPELARSRERRVGSDHIARPDRQNAERHVHTRVIVASATDGLAQ